MRETNVEEGKPMSKKKRLYHGTPFDVLPRMKREGRVRGMFTVRKTGDSSAHYWARVRIAELRSERKKRRGVVIRLRIPTSHLKKGTFAPYYKPRVGKKISTSFIEAVWVYEGPYKGWREYKTIAKALAVKRPI